MLLLEGQPVADSIQKKIKDAIEHTSKALRPPSLVAVLTTQHPASITYVKRKVKACQEIGIQSKVIEITPRSKKEIHDLVSSLNQDPSCDGILVQLPLPDNIDVLDVLEMIDPTKDVDGFHPNNVGKLLLGDTTGFIPCTPLGIKAMLEYYKIPIASRRVVIVGRSNIVGKPLAALLMQNSDTANATVTVAHSKTLHLESVCKEADILVAAIGKPHFITKNMVKPGAIVIDVGINRIVDTSKKSGFKLVGDVDSDQVKEVCSAISPVPGGVGPMTIAMLLANTYKSYSMRFGLQ